MFKYDWGIISKMDKGLIKNEKEIQTMLGLGKILSSIFDDMEEIVKPGVAVMDLEKLFIDRCARSNVKPSCKGYSEGSLPPFPTGLCLSINHQSVHCFPKEGIFLKMGDIVNIDTVISFNGLHVDNAKCFPVGGIGRNVEQLIKTTEKALYNAISEVKDGIKMGVISNTLQKTVEKDGFNVLKDYAGHGIGYSMHEYPEVPCYGNKNDGPTLKEGMTICIEALVCEGDDYVENMSEWETKMADGKRFCIFEHTVLVTRDSYEIITK